MMNKKIKKLQAVKTKTIKKYRNDGGVSADNFSLNQVNNSWTPGKINPTVSNVALSNACMFVDKARTKANNASTRGEVQYDDFRGKGVMSQF